MGCVDSRCVYARVTEVGVYIYLEQSDKGIGFALLEELVALIEAEGIRTLKAGIFREDIGSLCIHEKLALETFELEQKLESRTGFGEIQCFWKEEVIQSSDTKKYEENISALHGKQLQEPNCRRLLKAFCRR